MKQNNIISNIQEFFKEKGIPFCSKHKTILIGIICFSIPTIIGISKTNTLSNTIEDLSFEIDEQEETIDRLERENKDLKDENSDLQYKIQRIVEGYRRQKDYIRQQQEEIEDLRYNQVMRELDSDWPW